ncbi:carcinoembryonic antigen-related cell adhesion molecule 6-like [Dendropsophus ebraccatus]|uniref:carcinoembryonic antigen-related cell adhesion molecule 6-like n=1 Tax=Dendropsophus ebraccatus TaxID=150705 RepID=UPI0038313027
MYLQIHHFSHCMLLTVLLGLAVDVTSGVISIQLIPQYPVINGSVTLSVIGITGEIEYAIWYKGPGQAPQYRILTYFPGSSSSPLVPGPLHNPRFSPFNNGSIQIKDLLTTDGGNYIVKIQAEKQEDAIVTLTIYEPVTKPKITASITQPKENETLTLTCDTSNAVAIRWSRRGTSISSEARFSNDNKTLTFSSIKRAEAGQYQCEAQNLVSKDSSDPYTVSVTYGPDNVKIQGNMDTAYVRPGFSITLTCSADSSPPPEYLWRHNGTVLEGKTKDYVISAAMHKDEGTYMCTVKNPVTSRIAAVSVYLNVTAEYIGTPEGSKELGMTIGIIVAVVLLLVLIAAIIYLFIVHKRRKSSNDSNSNMKGSSRNGQADIPTQTAEQHELQYASIEFNKNKPRNEQKPEAIYENRSPQGAPPATDNVVYSELKLR